MRIHHVALRTADLARLEQFYGGVLGLEITRRDGTRSTWMRAGDTILMLEHASNDEPRIDPASMEMVAFAIDAEKRAEYIFAIEQAKIPVESQTAFTLYLRDPDGRRVGLSHYPTNFPGA